MTAHGLAGIGTARASMSERRPAERLSGCGEGVVSRETWSLKHRNFKANKRCPRAVFNLGIPLISMASGWLSGCGYEPVYSTERPEIRLTVQAAPYGTPNLEAVAATVSGVRRSLSSAGVLRPGEGYPRVMVEVTRVDERAAGMIAEQAAEGEERPSARAASLGVVGRAWIVEVEQGPRTRDTGDVRRTATYAVGSTTLAEQPRYEVAVRSAGHALGQALGRRILGEPETTFEPL